MSRRKPTFATTESGWSSKAITSAIAAVIFVALSLFSGSFSFFVKVSVSVQPLPQLQPCTRCMFVMFGSQVADEVCCVE